LRTQTITKRFTSTRSNKQAGHLCATQIEAAPPFVVFKGWAARLLALGRFAVPASSAPPDAVRLPAPGRAPREHTIENCSTATDRARGPIRVSRDCHECILVSQTFCRGSGPRKGSGAAKRAQPPGFSCQRRFWLGRSVRRNSGDSLRAKRCFRTCMKLEGVPFKFA
jgi:hypothetical protein